MMKNRQQICIYDMTISENFKHTAVFAEYYCYYKYEYVHEQQLPTTLPNVFVLGGRHF